MPDPDSPITPAEFAGLMSGASTIQAARNVVVGVSGGADSMALALLLRQWGDPLAVIVDHGLRHDSAAEAALTRQRLQDLGIPARIVTLTTLAKGPGLGARARDARYRALFAACRDAGRPDLLIAHHARDNLETIQLRAASGSGPLGLAGMAAVAWRANARILRPLLGIAPARLRATLRAAGVAWSEDPTNHDPATGRGALRTGIPVPPSQATPPARRAELERAIAAELARSVTLLPSGLAVIEGRLGPDAWSALLWTLSGQAHPPPRAATGRLAQTGQGTLHGVHIRSGMAAREAAAMAPAIPARAGSCWDGRFLLAQTVPGASLGPLDADAPRLRHRSTLPSFALRTLPALRMGTDLLAVPHLAYPDAETCLSVALEFRPGRPLAGLSFASA